MEYKRKEKRKTIILKKIRPGSVVIKARLPTITRRQKPEEYSDVTKLRNKDTCTKINKDARQFSGTCLTCVNHEMSPPHTHTWWNLNYTEVSLKSTRSTGVERGAGGRKERSGKKHVHLGSSGPESIMGKVAVVVQTAPRSPARQPPLTPQTPCPERQQTSRGPDQNYVTCVK